MLNLLALCLFAPACVMLYTQSAFSIHKAVGVTFSKLFVDLHILISMQEEKFQSRPSVKIFMHDRLKSLLVDDWEYITKNLQLVTLPSQMPASIILDEYAEQEKDKRHEGSAEWEILEEVIAGCKEYFNRCLGRILLYRFERQQFLEIYKQIEEPTGSIVGKSLAEVYGGEHLLRLFGKLDGGLILVTTSTDQFVQFLCPS